MRLKGEVAIVTGSASGIGRACALLLAQEGASVVVADLQPESRLAEERPNFYACRSVIPCMLEQGEGRIVNISSIHGIRGTDGATSYCASKGAIENLTKQLAAEYAPYNIRVNAVAPGTIYTAMCKPFLEKPALRAEYERRTLLPRLGVPEDVAYAVLYLASHESSYVVGHTLVIDGGWTIT